MSADKILAWGVVCGSGALHAYWTVDPEVYNLEVDAEQVAQAIDEYPDSNEGRCGKHRVVALVERPEEGR